MTWAVYLCIYSHQNVALNTGLVYYICEILDTPNYATICLCIMIGLAIVNGWLLLEKIYIVTAVDNVKLLVFMYTNRLKGQYLHIWRARCIENKKLSLYTHYKTNLTTEPYVDVLDIAKFRKGFASFRCSVHNLSIETGRHYGIQREIPYCECYIEDEFHFLLICPLYTVIRNVYIAKYYREYPTILCI